MTEKENAVLDTYNSLPEDHKDSVHAVAHAAAQAGLSLGVTGFLAVFRFVAANRSEIMSVLTSLWGLVRRGASVFGGTAPDSNPPADLESVASSRRVPNVTGVAHPVEGVSGEVDNPLVP